MKILILIIALTISSQIFGQTDRIDQIKIELETMLVDIPGLDETIASNVKDASVTEFLRGLGRDYGINLNVANGINQTLTNSFANARILDVLVLLCKEYSLDIEITGQILAVKRYITPEVIVEKVIREPGVEYNSTTDFLSLELKKDTLSTVAQKITSLSMHNVILSKGLEDLKVSCFIQNRPFDEVIEKMAYANGLIVTKDGNFYVLEKEVNTANNKGKKTPTDAEIEDSPRDYSGITLNVENDLISIQAENEKIADIIYRVSQETLNSFFIYDEPENSISLFLENATYEEFLTYLLRGTGQSFIKQDKVYLIGSENNYDLKTTELVQLKNRTIENVLSSSTSRRASSGSNSSNNNNNSSGQNRNSFAGSSFNSQLFSKDLSVQPFPELNSFIVSGSFPEVETFKTFIQKIDQVVPVVVIEVIIVDVNKNRTVSTGVQAGIGEAPSQSNGQILGGSDNNGLNLNLSTNDINSLINSFNGMGLVNLGHVTPNFYLSLQALETDGVLRSKDNIRLATLNSFPANINVGSEEYYLETTTNVTASAGNNLVTEQQNWIPLQADLSVEIVPVVSGDEQVTLQILVTQSSFTERAGGDNGPFGTVNREFNSNIRVKNGDMIMLGGLEDKTINNSGGGVPILSRIPILRWIFGNRTKSKSKSQLNIFIKPTIMY